MKYWKNGFYDELVEGAVEITEEYYNQLLNGQSAGLLIVDNQNGYPILVEYEYSFEDVIKNKVAEIQEFDKSEDVNSLVLGENVMWFDKSTRVGLFNSISIEKQMGKADTMLWYDATKYIIPISDALSMLDEIEMYALNCYNVTQSHIAAVRSLQTITEVENYNFKVGYPAKLKFPG